MASSVVNALGKRFRESLEISDETVTDERSCC